MNCPICAYQASKLRDLPSGFLRTAYELHFHGKIPQNLTIADYELWRCDSCTLEFVSPFEPGNSIFYDWVTRQEGYYPTERWEWTSVINQISHKNGFHSTLLEVGCGDGLFLDILRRKTNVKGIGLDLAAEAVERCQQKGLDVYKTDLTSFSANFGQAPRKFDYVAAFHCLEHVPDPKKLVQEMITAVKPHGSIFLSTPYSPMSFEASWFDPMNHPPHHITRWNLAAYRQLAKEFNMEVTASFPPAASLPRRTVNSFKISKGLSRSSLTKGRLAGLIATNITLFLLEFRKQLRRERINNAPAPDLILVELCLK